MRAGFASRALSVAVSVFLVGILFLTLPPKVDRDDAPAPIDETAADNSSAEPPPGASYADAPTGVVGVALPPPPVRLTAPTMAPAIGAAASPGAESSPTIEVEPLRPSVPETRASPLEVVEPLRPRPPADPAPPDRVRDTRRSLAIEEEGMDPVTAGDVKWVSEHPDSGADGEQPDPAVPPDPALMTEGRVLLRILEHGSGPTVEIAWPADPGERRRLFRRFESCFEMRLALMDLQGRLFTADGPRGRSWDLNLDRYSGFVRQTNGRLTAAEQGHIQDIRAFHGGLNGAAPVRIFPRRTDALLLGGLRQLTGDGYEHAKSIHASYRIAGDRVLVEAIQADGRPVHGNLDLSRAADPSCRGRSPT